MSTPTTPSTPPVTSLLKKLPAMATYVLVILALALGILWFIPADPPYYLIVPGSAQPVSTMITIHGHRASSTGGALYDTYVNQVKADHLLFVMFGLMRKDVSVEPASQVSAGCPDPAYERQLLGMMANSKLQAETAALHVLGYKLNTIDHGPEVALVFCNVPAAKVLHSGDRILKIDGRPTPDITQLKAAMALQAPGSTVHMTIRRAGKTRQVDVRTVHMDPRNGSIIPSGGRAFIGIEMNMPLKFPVKVRIDSGDVGGPSAGLAFALGIVQQLERKNLTHGNAVAVTGEIDLYNVCQKGKFWTPTATDAPAGSPCLLNKRISAHGYGPVQGISRTKAVVGPIGGARQKAIAAQAAGAKYFLVPQDNYAEAVSAGANLKIIPVRTLGDALHVLGSLPHQPHSGATSG